MNGRKEEMREDLGGMWLARIEERTVKRMMEKPKIIPRENGEGGNLGGECDRANCSRSVCCVGRGRSVRCV